MNNEAIIYDYRGLTADGRYYVEIIMPIDLPFLLSTYDPAANENPNAVPVPPLPEDFNERYTVIAAYNEELQQLIDVAAPAEFTPDLALIDMLASSLAVQP